jgi:hypothetical protein
MQIEIQGQLIMRICIRCPIIYCCSALQEAYEYCKYPTTHLVVNSIGRYYSLLLNSPIADGKYDSLVVKNVNSARAAEYNVIIHA